MYGKVNLPMRTGLLGTGVNLGKGTVEQVVSVVSIRRRKKEWNAIGIGRNALLVTLSVKEGGRTGKGRRKLRGKSCSPRSWGKSRKGGGAFFLLWEVEGGVRAVGEEWGK